MYYFLTTLHTILSTCPLGVKLAISGALAFGWMTGRTASEYAEALKRHSSRGIVLSTLCSRLAMLFVVAMIMDGMWFRSYPNMILAAGLLLWMVLAVIVCERMAHIAALRVVRANGYDGATVPIFPKRRGS